MSPANTLSSVKPHITPAQNAAARKVIRNLSSGLVSQTLRKSEDRPACGPFRAAMNAGDVLGRRFLQCDCPNPLGASKHGPNADAVSQNGCGLVVNGYTTKDAPVANCNTRYVYAASDYIAYKKMYAQKKGYLHNSRDANGTGSRSYIMHRLQRLR